MRKSSVYCAALLPLSYGSGASSPHNDLLRKAPQMLLYDALEGASLKISSCIPVFMTLLSVCQFVSVLAVLLLKATSYTHQSFNLISATCPTHYDEKPYEAPPILVEAVLPKRQL